MIRRSSRIALEVVGCLGAGLAILVAVAAWRLTSDDPLRLRFLTPYLEESLSATDGSYSVRIGDTVLTWGGWRRQLDLRASDVRVLDASGAEVATVPQIAIAISFSALLTGSIAPRAIELVGPNLVLERGEDGRFLLGEAQAAAGAAPDAPRQRATGVLPLLLAQLERDATGPAEYLREVGILDGSLTVQDRQAGLRWEAPDADIFLRRIADGVAAAVDLEVAQFGRPARLAADLIYDRTAASVQIEARFTGVDAPALGLIDPSLMMLTGADLVLDGSFSTRASLDGRIGETRFDLGSGPGALSLPGQYDEPLVVKSMKLQGTVDPAVGNIDVADSYLELDGARLDIDGTLRDEGGDVVLTGRFGVALLTVDDLKRYWPVRAARSARDWVSENMFDGTARDARLDLRLRLVDGLLDAVRVEQAYGTLQASGLTVHYLDGLPPIRNGAGTARFDRDRFLADIVSGDAQGIDIRSARLAITELSAPWQFIAIDGQLDSTLGEALQLLEGGELGYATKLGIDPAHAEGSMATALSVSLPAAINDISEVEIAAEATIEDAVLGNAVLGRDLTAGDLRLRVDKQGMNVEGTARVADIPAQLIWRENFDEAAYRSQIALAATTYPDQRLALGLDLMPFLDGPVGTDLLYTRYWTGRSNLAAQLDLARATLALGVLGWRKAPGQPGTATLEAELHSGTVVAVPRLTIEAGSLAAEGRALDVAGDPLGGLALDRLRVGLTDLREVTLQRVGERIDITAAGGTFDAEPVLAQREAVPEVEAMEPRQAFTVRTARLDWLRLGADRALADVRLGLHNDGLQWQEIQLDASLQTGEPLVLRYLPEQPGRHRLQLATDNAGSALRLIGVTQGMIGGRLSVDAVSDDTVAGAPLKGRAVIYDFRMFRAPVLARILAIATFTGLVDAMTGGDGFLFDRFIGDFSKTGDRVDIELARAYGATLGITAEGTIDLASDTMELKGTLIPLFAFNNLLANIPLVGDLLTAGQGGGIFAATYQASGSLKQPEVSVNPVAALAPGVLRELFDLGDAGVSRAVPEDWPPARGGKD